MFYFHKVEYVQYLGEVDIFHIWVQKFILLYNSAKIIKIDRDFPKLWSQMSATFLWFTVYISSSLSLETLECSKACRIRYKNSSRFSQSNIVIINF